MKHKTEWDKELLDVFVVRIKALSAATQERFGNVPPSKLAEVLVKATVWNYTDNDGDVCKLREILVLLESAWEHFHDEYPPQDQSLIKQVLFFYRLYSPDTKKR